MSETLDVLRFHLNFLNKRFFSLIFLFCCFVVVVVVVVLFCFVLVAPGVHHAIVVITYWLNVDFFS